MKVSFVVVVCVVLCNMRTYFLAAVALGCLCSFALASGQDDDKHNETLLEVPNTFYDDNKSGLSFTLAFRGKTEVRSVSLAGNTIRIFFDEERDVVIDTGFNGKIEGCITDIGNLLCCVNVDTSLQVDFSQSAFSVERCTRVPQNSGGYSCKLKNSKGSSDYQGSLVFSPITKIASLSESTKTIDVNVPY